MRELRGATLALIVERPSHGYELTHRLNRRLGPTWPIEPRQIYKVLDELAEAGLIHSADDPTAGYARMRRVVYYPTEHAALTLQSWMQTEVDQVPLRPNVIARLVSATPSDAKELLRILDDYETELLRLLEANDDAGLPVRSWQGLMLWAARSHTDSHLQGEFQWLVAVRRRVREFMAAQ